MQPRILTALAKDSAHLNSPLGVAHMLHHLPILGLGLTRKTQTFTQSGGGCAQEQKPSSWQLRTLPDLPYKVALTQLCNANRNMLHKRLGDLLTTYIYPKLEDERKDFATNEPS